MALIWSGVNSYCPHFTQLQINLFVGSVLLSWNPCAVDLNNRKFSQIMAEAELESLLEECPLIEVTI